MNWSILGFRRWSDFGGRSGRREYISFIYPIYGLIVAAYVALNRFFGNPPPDWAIIAFFVGMLALAVPIWAITVRRMHDINLPGGILVLGAFIPGLNFLFLILLSLIPGTRGENNYGDEAGVPSDYFGKI
ncbi:DUF805 domain-containing protein [Sphingomonas sp. LB-2]|uniref:DUF805 domain-containing protein n=1 Tax=Sphingomonas caeni TaxID=2984949 RepID=UPI002230F044|nr:DUF805 domain-containing protein [Sphingomonas caeni]MCW3846184.1 DUF805 domain-containing protein [Sphingomonas caeni]